MMKQENIFQHFKKDEQGFISDVQQWLQTVTDQYTPYLTNFLNPREIFILQSVMGKREGIKLHLWGGYPDAERQRAIISPDYFEPELTDFAIQLCQINYPVKFATLSHGQILGTLLNIGLKRDSFGDIITDDSKWQFFVNQNISQFSALQVEKVGRITVRIEMKEIDDCIQPIVEWEDSEILLGSFRLDQVVATVFHLSRQRVKEMIQAGKVKINWVETEKPDAEIAIFDILSVRGFGRIQLKELLGTTKKDKMRVRIQQLKK